MQFILHYVSIIFLPIPSYFWLFLSYILFDIVFYIFFQIPSLIFKIFFFPSCS